jgi:hypothetical protein
VRGDDILIDDPLLPSQYHDRISRSGEGSPELRLLAALLELAVVDYQGDCWVAEASHSPESRGRRQKIYQQRAAGWFFAPGNGTLCDFTSVCAHLGIDPEGFRERLRSGRVTPLRYQRRVGREQNGRHAVMVIRSRRRRAAGR